MPSFQCIVRRGLWQKSLSHPKHANQTSAFSHGTAASLELGPHLFGRQRWRGSILTSFKSIAADPNRTQPSPILVAGDPSQVSSTALTPRDRPRDQVCHQERPRTPAVPSVGRSDRDRNYPRSGDRSTPHLQPVSNHLSSNPRVLSPHHNPRPPPPPGSHPPLLRSASSDPAPSQSTTTRLWAHKKPIHLGRLKHPIASCRRRSDEEILPQRL